MFILEELKRHYFENTDQDFIKNYKAAQKGEPAAQVLVGKQYACGIRIWEYDDEEEDIVYRRPAYPHYKKAVYWYTKAAKQGYAEAQYLLGEKYERGQGVWWKSAKTALYWYRLAAQQNYDEALYRLGEIYEEGTIVPKDEKQAMEWYQKAGLQEGYAWSWEKCLEMHMRGIVSSSITPQTLAQYRKAAKEYKNKWAAYKLALMYEQERNGLPSNEKQAVYFYQLAATHKFPEVYNKLASIYEYGRGEIPKDYQQAREFYKKAAYQGYVQAQFNLARMYEDGRGSPSNYEKAVYWYQIAANKGFQGAQDALERVNQLLKDKTLQNQDVFFEDLAEDEKKYEYNSIPYNIPYGSTAADINSEIKENVVQPHSYHSLLKNVVQSYSYHSLLEDVLDTDEEAALDSDEEDSDDEEIFTNNTIPSSYGNISPDPGQSSNMPGVMPNPTTYNSHSQEKYESFSLQDLSETFFNAWQESDIKEAVSESNVSYDFHRLQNRHSKTSLAEFTNLNFRVEMLQQKFLVMEQALVDPLERKEDLDKLNKFRQGKLYYQHFRNMLHLPLLAHKVIATGLVTTPPSPLAKKMELALSLITPFMEIVRKLVEKSISAIEHEVGAANSKRIQIAASVTETENVIDYTARKIALAYQPLLEHIEEDAQIEALAEYAVGRLLDYIQEHSEAISKDNYVNSDEIFPETASQEEFLDHGSRALITHKPENEASLTAKTLLLQALEATNKIVEYTEPLKLLMRIYKSITKIKYITLSDNIKLSFEQAYTLGIHLNDIEHLYPPYYLRPKNAGMIKSLQDLGCATRAAFFKCDNLKTLEPHQWRLQLIPQSQNKEDGLPQANIQEVAKKVEKQAHQLQHVTTEITDLKSKFSLFFNPEISHAVEIDNGDQVQLAAQVSQQKQQTSPAASSTAQFDKQELQDDRLQLQLLTYQVAAITEELENAAKKKEAKCAKNTSPPESSVSSALSETMLIKQQVQTDQQVVLISNQLMFITEQLNQLSARMNQLEEENSRKTNHYRKYGT